MRWPPSEFWQATPNELALAVKGYLTSKGIKADEPDPDFLEWVKQEEEKDQNGKKY